MRTSKPLTIAAAPVATVACEGSQTGRQTDYPKRLVAVFDELGDAFDTDTEQSPGLITALRDLSRQAQAQGAEWSRFIAVGLRK